MAGDWIPVQTNLSRRREILVLAERLGKPRHEVMGLVVDLWCWASEESRNGHVSTVTPQMLENAIGGSKRFWEELGEVGWLIWEDGGVTIPNWDRWLAKSSKGRLLNILQKRAERSGEGQNDTDSSRSDRDQNVTREDRGEMRDDTHPLSPSKGGESENGDLPEEIRSYNRLAVKHGLTPAKEADPRRLKRLRGVLKDTPDLWDRLEAELSALSEWSRDRKRRLFSLAQLVKGDRLTNLLEGFYRGDSEAKKVNQERRDKAIGKLRARVGQTAIPRIRREGLEEATVETHGCGLFRGDNGFRPWAVFELEDLEALADPECYLWEKGGEA